MAMLSSADRVTRIAHPAYGGELGSAVPFVKRVRDDAKNSGAWGLKHVAFTLAETLITLAIIGVIAALTVPTLYAKYQKAQWVAGLQKAYVTLSNAVRLTRAQGPFIFCNEVEPDLCWTTNPIIFNNIISKLKVSKNCGYQGWTNTCLPYFNASNIKDINGNNPTVSNQDFALFYSVILADGTILIFKFNQQGGGTHRWEYTSPLRIMVDVNGTKPPNTFGRDIFFFGVDNTGLKPYTVHKTYQTEWNRGFEMADIITKDGWQMNY